MEETIGKRIIANRKRLGMTQDRLAEQLGVTAQAVSKWENDQSCPDITILPLLAEIFGITTDTLLGIAQAQPVREAEVVAEPDDHGIHVDNHGGHWEVKWDGGRKNSIGLALWVLLMGGLLLASSILHWDADLWEIAWPSGLLIFGLFGLFPRFSFFRLGCTLFGGYFLLNNLIPEMFTLEREYLLPIFLLLFGLSLLMDALRKNKRPSFRVFHNGEPVSTGNGKWNQATCNYAIDGETFDCSASFGSDRQYVRLPRLSRGEASVSFGELEIDLSGCQEVADDCFIDASCSFGELTIYVPNHFRVESATNTAFGEVNISGHPNSDAAGVIHMDCSVSFGEIEIRYI